LSVAFDACQLKGGGPTFLGVLALLEVDGREEVSGTVRSCGTCMSSKLGAASRASWFAAGFCSHPLLSSIASMPKNQT
jgi:hypothetical protein